MYPRQLTTVEQAVAQIKDGAILSFNGIGMIGLAERFFPAMEQRFQCGGHPNSLTLYSACGLGGKNPRNLLFGTSWHGFLHYSGLHFPLCCVRPRYQG